MHMTHYEFLLWATKHPDETQLLGDAVRLLVPGLSFSERQAIVAPLAEKLSAAIDVLQLPIRSDNVGSDQDRALALDRFTAMWAKRNGAEPYRVDQQFPWLMQANELLSWLVRPISFA